MTGPLTLSAKPGTKVSKPMNQDRLTTLLSRFPALTVLVVGDFFLDKYLIIEHALGEISLETGLEAHQVVGVRCQPGAAGTVTNNLRAMGVNVLAAGIVGDDGEGFELLRDVGYDRRERGCAGHSLRPLHAHLHQADVARAGRQRGRAEPAGHQKPDSAGCRRREPAHRPSARPAPARPRRHYRRPGAGDGLRRHHRAGARRATVLAQAYPTVAFLADSRVRIGLYEDVILKPNAREAASAVQPDFNGEPDRTVAEAAAVALYAKTGQPVFLTLGGDGIMAFHADGPTHIPAVPVTGPIDIVGAGDATMAGICSAGATDGGDLLGAMCGRHRARGRAGRLPGRRGDDPTDRDDGDRVSGADRGAKPTIDRNEK